MVRRVSASGISITKAMRNEWHVMERSKGNNFKCFIRQESVEFLEKAICREDPTYTRDYIMVFILYSS